MTDSDTADDGTESGAGTAPEGWADELRANRAEKDRFLAEHRQSPIPPDEREDFDGLAYFDPDPAYRVEATATVHDDPELVELATSDGLTVDYRRVVTLAFGLDGERRLHGYRRAEELTEGDDGTLDGSERVELFVPFRDLTTGQQTYDGGRYMELTVEGGLSDGDRVPLDFNLAYFPFCAYSETFSCPLPPEENWLETTVEAGERY